MSVGVLLVYRNPMGANQSLAAPQDMACHSAPRADPRGQRSKWLKRLGSQGRTLWFNMRGLFPQETARSGIVGDQHGTLLFDRNGAEIFRVFNRQSCPNTGVGSS